MPQLSRWEGRAAPRSSTDPGCSSAPRERAEGRGSRAEMANPTPAPLQLGVQAAWELCVARSIGYYASQAALVTISHGWEAAQVAACTWGCAAGMQGCSGRAAPFAALCPTALLTHQSRQDHFMCGLLRLLSTKLSHVSPFHVCL